MAENIVIFPNHNASKLLHEETLEVAKLVYGPGKRADSDVGDMEDSFKLVGQLHPLAVRRNGDGQFEVLAGNRRLTAAKNLGMKTLRAVIIDGDDKLAQLVTIDENLVRLALSKRERAEYLAKQKALYELLHPEAAHGGKRGGGQHGHLKGPKKDSFAKKVAKATGTSARKVRRDVKIGEKAIPAVKEAWDGDQISDDEAERLAGRPAAVQHDELLRVVASPVRLVPAEEFAADGGGEPARSIPAFSAKGTESMTSATAAVERLQAEAENLFATLRASLPDAQGAIALLDVIGAVRTMLNDMALLLRPIAAHQPPGAAVAAIAGTATP